MADPNIQKCLGMLKSAATDNDKLAGIMMVTKVIKAENCDSEMKQKICDAIGLKFLIRLMRSSNVPEGCPSTIYKSMAINILSALCTDSIVAAQPEMKSLVSALNEIILTPPRNEEAEIDSNLLNDCYECLYGLAYSKRGQLHLIEGNSVASLVEAVVTETPGDEQAVEILLILAGYHGNEMWRKQTSACNKLINYLTLQFTQRKDLSKFDLCPTLISFISTLEKVPPNDTSSSLPWMRGLVSTLSTDFKNKLGVEQRQCLLLLVCELVEKCGLSCLLPPFIEDCKIVLLITHLVCIEVRMVLENLTWEQIHNKTSLLCSCYTLLENIINHMVTEQPMGFQQSQVLQVHSAMVGAFNGVLFFLDEVSVERSKKWINPVVTASVRVLGAWLAEETTALKLNIYKILPFLLQLIQISFDPNLASDLPEVRPAVETMLQECDISDNQSQKAIQSVTESVEVNQSEDSKQNGAKPRSKKRVQFSQSDLDSENDNKDVVDILRFLLPGLNHLSAEDEPRQILKDNNIQDILLKYFICKWKMFLEHENGEEAVQIQDTLASLCGVFLNFSVTESQLVGQDDCFHSLLNNLYTALPHTIYNRENLILTANFTLLGLMILQHQDSLIDENDYRNKYLSSCISFFSHAFYLKENKDGRPAIALTKDYEACWTDISVCWYLGIQALCACIKVIPVFPNLILKSGWLVNIVKMLLDVKGVNIEEDMTSVLLQLFISLSKSHQPCRNILIEKGGKELARIYRNTELKDILSQ